MISLFVNDDNVDDDDDDEVVVVVAVVLDEGSNSCTSATILSIMLHVDKPIPCKRESSAPSTSI
jgi:hypothetical protein